MRCGFGFKVTIVSDDGNSIRFANWRKKTSTFYGIVGFDFQIVTKKGRIIKWIVKWIRCSFDMNYMTE